MGLFDGKRPTKIGHHMRLICIYLEHLYRVAKMHRMP